GTSAAPVLEFDLTKLALGSIALFAGGLLLFREIRRGQQRPGFEVLVGPQVADNIKWVRRRQSRAAPSTPLPGQLHSGGRGFCRAAVDDDFGSAGASPSRLWRATGELAVPPVSPAPAH